MREHSLIDTTPLTRLHIAPATLPDSWCNPAWALRPHDTEGFDVHFGAISTFCGVVRNHHHGRGVNYIEYECHHKMAISILHQLVAEVRQQCDSTAAVAVAHASGHVVPGQLAVVIHVASAHRAAACDGCRHLIERIKEDLPVWKHEHYHDGTSQWLPGS